MKTLNHTIYIVFLFFMLSLTSCDPSDNRLTVYNQSDRDIVLLYSVNYPDTVDYKLSNCNALTTVNADVYKAKENDMYSLFSVTWEQFLEDIESKTLMMFIYDLDTANSYYNKYGNCDSLKGKELKRVDITMEYLNNTNYSITYP